MRGEPLKYHEDKMEKSSKQPNKYCCKLCDKSFMQSRNLESHIKNVHQGIIFKCSSCDKNFNHPAKSPRPFAHRYLPTDIGPQTFAHGHLPTDICPRIFAHGHLPTKSISPRPNAHGQMPTFDTVPIMFCGLLSRGHFFVGKWS